MQPPVTPNSRTLIGMAAILLLILVWSVAAVSAFDLIAHLPWPVHALYFTAAGIGWVLPLKPLIRWMQSGR